MSAYSKVIQASGLGPNAQNDAGWLFLLLSLGDAVDSSGDVAATNPVDVVFAKLAAHGLANTWAGQRARQMLNATRERSMK
jgi:hypothetical protein